MPFCLWQRLHCNGENSLFSKRFWVSWTSIWILEKEMATHSSILAWRIPWAEEPGRLQFMRLKRVRHDWATEQQQQPIRIAKQPKHWQHYILVRMYKNRNSYSRLTKKGKMTQSLWKRICQFLRKLSMLCFCSVTQSCLTLCDHMDCRRTGLSVPHHLPKFAQVHVHCISEI